MGRSSAAVSGNSACTLPKKVGDCRAAMPRVFFNSQSGKCEDFIYGGCGGNANNFHTMEECKKACMS
ncbi:predicted protein [Nematostella vectensis]|uniref:BPTI/Kunitz inhibitor domain-containing protein n=1 Tax=Nematostella vectensis TaxID=45351 RepID=A7T2J6_NEMVE|nr:predicted protein [Nematostella vectensis]|eukprot:XP_001621919.1 hypothetical protein NEMVEDRAFT_v1g143195 [Nematostella vectensis]